VIPASPGVTPTPPPSGYQTGRFTAPRPVGDPLGAQGGDMDWYGYCVDDPVNRVDVWGLEGFLDGVQKITAGFGQLWDTAPDGIAQAVSEGAQGAGEALGKTAEAYATNEDLRNYTATALGAGAVPIAAAAGVEALPAIAAVAARNPDKIENAFDFLSGAFVPGPPPMTTAGQAGGIGSWMYNEWGK